MKRVSRIVCVVALAAGAGLGAIAPASADESVGGGTWDHGVSASTTWSFYLHPSKAHRSSVTTSNDYQTSQWRGVNVWSIAQLTSTVSGNKANWATR